MSMPLRARQAFFSLFSFTVLSLVLIVLVAQTSAETIDGSSQGCLAARRAAANGTFEGTQTAGTQEVGDKCIAAAYDPSKVQQGEYSPWTNPDNYTCTGKLIEVSVSDGKTTERWKASPLKQVPAGTCKCVKGCDALKQLPPQSPSGGQQAGGQTPQLPIPELPKPPSGGGSDPNQQSAALPPDQQCGLSDMGCAPSYVAQTPTPDKSAEEINKIAGQDTPGTEQPKSWWQSVKDFVAGEPNTAKLNPEAFPRLTDGPEPPSGADPNAPVSNNTFAGQPPDGIDPTKTEPTQPSASFWDKYAPDWLKDGAKYAGETLDKYNPFNIEAEAKPANFGKETPIGRATFYDPVKGQGGNKNFHGGIIDRNGPEMASNVLPQLSVQYGCYGATCEYFAVTDKGAAADHMRPFAQRAGWEDKGVVQMKYTEVARGSTYQEAIQIANQLNAANVPPNQNAIAQVLSPQNSPPVTVASIPQDASPVVASSNPAPTWGEVVSSARAGGDPRFSPIPAPQVYVPSSDIPVFTELPSEAYAQASYASQQSPGTSLSRGIGQTPPQVYVPSGDPPFTGVGTQADVESTYLSPQAFETLPAPDVPTPQQIAQWESQQRLDRIAQADRETAQYNEQRRDLMPGGAPVTPVQREPLSPLPETSPVVAQTQTSCSGSAASCWLEANAPNNVVGDAMRGTSNAIRSANETVANWLYGAPAPTQPETSVAQTENSPTSFADLFVFESEKPAPSAQSAGEVPANPGPATPAGIDPNTPPVNSQVYYDAFGGQHQTQDAAASVDRAAGIGVTQQAPGTSLSRGIGQEQQQSTQVYVPSGEPPFSENGTQADEERKYLSPEAVETPRQEPGRLERVWNGVRDGVANLFTPTPPSDQTPSGVSGPFDFMTPATQQGEQQTPAAPDTQLGRGIGSTQGTELRDDERFFEPRTDIPISRGDMASEQVRIQAQRDAELAAERAQNQVVQQPVQPEESRNWWERTMPEVLGGKPAPIQGPSLAEQAGINNIPSSEQQVYVPDGEPPFTEKQGQTPTQQTTSSDVPLPRSAPGGPNRNIVTYDEDNSKIGEHGSTAVARELIAKDFPARAQDQIALQFEKSLVSNPAALKEFCPTCSIRNGKVIWPDSADLNMGALQNEQFQNSFRNNIEGASLVRASQFDSPDGVKAWVASIGAPPPVQTQEVTNASVNDGGNGSNVSEVPPQDDRNGWQKYAPTWFGGKEPGDTRTYLERVLPEGFGGKPITGTQPVTLASLPPPTDVPSNAAIGSVSGPIDFTAPLLDSTSDLSLSPEQNTPPFLQRVGDVEEPLNAALMTRAERQAEIAQILARLGESPEDIQEVSDLSTRYLALSDANPSAMTKVERQAEMAQIRSRLGESPEDVAEVRDLSSRYLALSEAEKDTSKESIKTVQNKTSVAPAPTPVSPTSAANSFHSTLNALNAKNASGINPTVNDLRRVVSTAGALSKAGERLLPYQGAEFQSLYRQVKAEVDPYIRSGDMQAARLNLGYKIPYVLSGLAQKRKAIGI